MRRPASLPVRLVAAWSLLLALGAGVDLHFAVEAGPVAHGLLAPGHGSVSGGEVVVAAEPCDRQDRLHVEAARSSIARPCPLCLRSVETRALAARTAARADKTPVSGPSDLDQGRVHAAPPTSPSSVRGPPIA